MKNCTLKDEGQRRTVLMNSRTQLEQTNVEFAFLGIPPVENISSLSAINENQLVTIKAKVVQLFGKKITNTRWEQRKSEKDSLSTHSAPLELWYGITSAMRSKMAKHTVLKTLSPFSTRRICSRDAKRKQESGNVIG